MALNLALASKSKTHDPGPEDHGIGLSLNKDQWLTPLPRFKRPMALALAWKTLSLGIGLKNPRRYHWQGRRSPMALALALKASGLGLKHAALKTFLL